MIGLLQRKINWNGIEGNLRGDRVSRGENTMSGAFLQGVGVTLKRDRSINKKIRL